MKMIDQKGRLFGLINIIDLLFILIILFALVGGVKKYQQKVPVAEGTKEGTVTFLVTNIRQLSIDQMVIGDQIYHYDKGGLLGSIEEVKSEPYTDLVEYQGGWVDAPVPNKYQAYLKVKVDYTESQDAYTVGGEAMRVGSEYRLKTKRNTFYGTCVDMSVLHQDK